MLPEKEEIGINPDWMPLKRISQYFDSGNTQMSQLETKYKLVVAKSWKKKIVHRQSVADLLNSSSNKAMHKQNISN